MAAPTDNSAIPGCPRCGTGHTRIVAHSPVAGAWQMYLCQTCFYSWRSTEPDQVTVASHIPAIFRVDAAAIRDGKVMPAIPPLRQTPG
jgi:hypothetical protein